MYTGFGRLLFSNHPFDRPTATRSSTWPPTTLLHTASVPLSTSLSMPLSAQRTTCQSPLHFSINGTLLTLFEYEALIPRCPRRVASGCKCRGHTSTDTRSLNYLGERLRILLISKPLTGALTFKSFLALRTAH